MLPIAFLIILFFFLVIGATAFLLCILDPPKRQYALSAALWFALWGPCLIAMLMFAGLAIVANALLPGEEHLHRPHVTGLLPVAGWGFLVMAVLGTTAFATACAWLHQTVTRLLPFALFRCYAMLVTAGIGSVFGWCFNLYLSSFVYQHLFWLWGLLGMLVLITSFGTAGWKGASSLRSAPRTTNGGLQG